MPLRRARLRPGNGLWARQSRRADRELRFGSPGLQRQISGGDQAGGWGAPPGEALHSGAIVSRHQSGEITATAACHHTCREPPIVVHRLGLAVLGHRHLPAFGRLWPLINPPITPMLLGRRHHMGLQARTARLSVMSLAAVSGALLLHTVHKDGQIRLVSHRAVTPSAAGAKYGSRGDEDKREVSGMSLAAVAGVPHLLRHSPTPPVPYRGMVPSAADLR